MSGMRHCDSHGNWAAGRRRRRHFGGHGFGGRHGIGDGDMMRAGRMLAQGDLRLIALALIAEQPRHGYEIIKVLEEKTSDWYSPSPGIVYPTLTYLEDVGYLTAQAEGSKKLYSITDQGRAHLEQNRDLVDAVLDRLAAIGERFARWRRMQSRETEDVRGSRLPRLIDAALDNLREEAMKKIESDADAEARIVEILARAATDLRRT